MSTIASRKQKARRLQQFVRDLMLRFAESLALDDVRSTPMGVSGEDIQLSTAAREIYPWSVECKAQEKVNVYKAYSQAQDNNTGDYEPIVFFSKNHHKPMVMLDAEYFVRMWRKQ